MRVQFQTEGGIAHFPGLSKPVTIDDAQLAQQDAAELHRLLGAARFFDLPAATRTRASAATPARGAADYRQYTISVEDGDRRHTIRLADPIEDPDLQALVDYLSRQATQIRRAGGQPSDSDR